ncbi:hypothetical protein AVEN_269222-1 [Araneus ventricosus]|uniref:Uncharacterized protein n=1 Tax=Araneus ventricosus TaxID=182803 RepID=A0A4Y2I1I6_ARAVE|nr:hypothetical protein AVEN_269222-1 [Araneus ventricosus]
MLIASSSFALCNAVACLPHEGIPQLLEILYSIGSVMASWQGLKIVTGRLKTRFRERYSVYTDSAHDGYVKRHFTGLVWKLGERAVG